VKVKTGPPGFLASRTATARGRTATSTQLPLEPLKPDLRQQASGRSGAIISGSLAVVFCCDPRNEIEGFVEVQG
jgi:hypothetical protein